VRWLSRLVSILLIAMAVVGFGMFIRSKMPVTEVGEQFTTCATFRDGSKLALGSPVMIAGVRVGEVSKLTIQGAYARIDMLLRNETQVAIDSWVTKRAYSPFGDSYIEILPGGVEGGAANSQMLRPGQCLTRVAEGSSTDTMLRQLERTMPRVDDGLERIHEVATYGRNWAVGTLEDKTLDAEHWLDEGHIESPLQSADQALARLESAAVGAADRLHGSAPNVLRTMDRLASGIATARVKMAEVRGDLTTGLQNARDGMNDVDQTIADVQEIVAAVDEGRGTDAKGSVGRLINDPTLANDIEEATESLREGVGSFSRFKSWLGLRVEWNIFSNAPRFFVTARARAAW
jgi:phospholipid/cholesterol/gamma-HCH transport system substrate-binding protein